MASQSGTWELFSSSREPGNTNHFFLTVIEGFCGQKTGCCGCIGTQTIFTQLMLSVQFFLIDKSGYGSIPLLPECFFLNLDDRSIPLFPDSFLEVLDDVCHDPGFCGKLCRVSPQKMSGIDDACTGQFFNH